MLSASHCEYMRKYFMHGTIQNVDHKWNMTRTHGLYHCRNLFLKRLFSLFILLTLDFATTPSLRLKLILILMSNGKHQCHSNVKRIRKYFQFWTFWRINLSFPRLKINSMLNMCLCACACHWQKSKISVCTVGSSGVGLCAINCHFLQLTKSMQNVSKTLAIGDIIRTNSCFQADSQWFFHMHLRIQRIQKLCVKF